MVKTLLFWEPAMFQRKFSFVAWWCDRQYCVILHDRILFFRKLCLAKANVVWSYLSYSVGCHKFEAFLLFPYSAWEEGLCFLMGHMEKMNLWLGVRDVKLWKEEISECCAWRKDWDERAVLEHLPWGSRARRTNLNPDQRCSEGTYNTFCRSLFMRYFWWPSWSRKHTSNHHLKIPS